MRLFNLRLVSFAAGLGLAIPACGGGSADFAGLEIGFRLGAGIEPDQMQLRANIGLAVLFAPKFFPETAAGKLKPTDTVTLLLAKDKGGTKITVAGTPFAMGAALAGEEMADSPALVSGDTVKMTLNFGAPPDDGGMDLPPIEPGGEPPPGTEPPKDGPATDKPIDMPMDGPLVDKPPDLPPLDKPPDLSPDGPAVCTPKGSPCDPVCQTGCLSIEECVITCGGTPGPKCVPNVGSGALGSKGCTGGSTDSCDRGLVCIANTGCGNRCERFCYEDGDCPSGYGCDSEIQCSMSTVAQICYKKCDPVGTGATTSCPDSSDGCYPATPSTPGIGIPQPTTCHCKGSKARDAVCDRTSDCLPGNVCVDDGTGTGRCFAVCELASPSTCPAGTDCMALVDWDRWGACFPP